MAETQPGDAVPAGEDQYDDTIRTPDDTDVRDTGIANPSDGAADADVPPAGEQPSPDGAADADGVPLRADGTQARAKGEVS